MSTERQDEFLARASIQRTTDELLEGRISHTAGRFAEMGLPPPSVRWDPGEDDLPFPQHRFLLDYWRALRGAEDIPRYARVDAMQLKPALGYVMLLDVLDDGWDYRYRVYGSEIARYTQRDYTGMRTSELFRSAIPMFYLGGYRAVLVRRLPLYTENQAPPQIAVRSWHRLVLPLADDAGRIARFIVGNVPGPWRSPSQDLDE